MTKTIKGKTTHKGVLEPSYWLNRVTGDSYDLSGFAKNAIAIHFSNNTHSRKPITIIYHLIVPLEIISCHMQILKTSVHFNFFKTFETVTNKVFFYGRQSKVLTHIKVLVIQRTNNIKKTTYFKSITCMANIYKYQF